MIDETFGRNAQSGPAVLRAAYKAGEPVLLDLIMNLGDKDELPKPRAHTGYRIIPVETVSQYLDIRRELVAINDAAFFDSIKVGYKGNARSHDIFDVGNDEEKLVKLYKSIRTGREQVKMKELGPKNKPALQAFPRFLLFHRTHDARRVYAKNEEIGGFITTMDSNSGAEMLLMNKVHVRAAKQSEDIRKTLLSNNFICVIARPWVLENESRNNLIRLNQAAGAQPAQKEKIWPFIGWTLHSDRQLALAPNLSALHLPKKIEIQESAAHEPVKQPEKTAPAQLGLFDID